MSAENRSSINFQRCCSFCRRTGHRITNCNDERLDDFERRCIDSLNDNQFNEISFRNYLLDQAIIDPQLLKAFAIKKCGLSTRHQINTYIENIINYFRPFMSERQNAGIASHEQVQQSVQNQSIAIMSQTSLLRSMFNLLSTSISTNDNERTNAIEQIRAYMLFIEAIREIGEYDEDKLNDRKFNINTNVIEFDEITDEKCDCDICYENCSKKDFIKLNCNHEFCKECIKNSLKNERKDIPCCAVCRTQIVSFGIRDEIIKNEFTELII